MAINPVSPNNYLVQLFQPSSSGQEHGTHQTETPGSLDAVINSVRQQTFKVPDWMQKVYGVEATTNDLGQFARDLEVKRLNQVVSDLESEIDKSRVIGDFERISVLQEQIAGYKDKPEEVSGFLVKGERISGFVLSSGLVSYGTGNGGATLWSNLGEPLRPENAHKLDKNFVDKILFV